MPKGSLNLLARDELYRPDIQCKQPGLLVIQQETHLPDTGVNDRAGAWYATSTENRYKLIQRQVQGLPFMDTGEFGPYSPKKKSVPGDAPETD